MKHTLRENFKNLRNKVGISQSQLADFLNLDQSLISKFEKGERSLEVSALERSCALFGCT
ncbi:MAG: helix-turn-helix transcriptional regulator, partial [Erysipelothrix sp.]|nr:helix-turn-helix transcriptional regulator [Erysipelothrix sp.]